MILTRDNTNHPQCYIPRRNAWKHLEKVERTALLHYFLPTSLSPQTPHEEPPTERARESMNKRVYYAHASYNNSNTMCGKGTEAIVEEGSNKSKSASKRTTVVKAVTERNESIVMEAKAERAHIVCVKKR